MSKSEDISLYLSFLKTYKFAKDLFITFIKTIAEGRAITSINIMAKFAFR